MINNPNLACLVIVSTTPWANGDWVKSTKERELIGKMLQDLQEKHKKTVIFVSGDNHMLAFDNGFNNNYRFMSLVAAPLE